MSRIAVPRWTILTMVIALVASMAFSIGAFSSAIGSSHEDTPFYGCAYAGSLSQVSTNPPANCGRGTMVTWPSYADFVALQTQLDTDVTDLLGQLDAEELARLTADTNLNDLIVALTVRVSDLEIENGEQQAEITDLQADLAAEIAARQAAITDLQNQIDDLQNQINAEALARQTADTALQNSINTEATTRAAADTNLQSQINALSTTVSGIQTTLSQVSSALDALELIVDGIDAALQIVEDAIVVINDVIDAIESVIDAIEGIVCGLSDDC